MNLRGISFQFFQILFITTFANRLILVADLALLLAALVCNAPALLHALVIVVIAVLVCAALALLHALVIAGLVLAALELLHALVIAGLVLAALELLHAMHVLFRPEFVFMHLSLPVCLRRRGA